MNEEDDNKNEIAYVENLVERTDQLIHDLIRFRSGLEIIVNTKNLDLISIIMDTTMDAPERVRSYLKRLPKVWITSTQISKDLDISQSYTRRIIGKTLSFEEDFRVKATTPYKIRYYPDEET